MIWSAAAGAFVLAIILGSLAAVGAWADWQGGLGAADWSALRFTVTQALVSAIVSTALAVPVARALARRDFPGRGAFLTLLGAPFLLPVIVAILGLLAVFGRSGWISAGLGVIGLPPLSIYGMIGVVLAHVFLNLPLATRLILQGWARVPAEQLRLTASLGASAWETVEWPMLRRVLPGVLVIVFVICLSSFAVALILGGGPRATTIELAIYQAIRFEFDLGSAALLAALQATLGLLAALALWWSLRGGLDAAAGLDGVVERWDGNRWVDATWLIAALGLLLCPILAICWAGLTGLPDLPGSAWPALGRSLMVALGAMVFCLCLALPLSLRQGAFATFASVVPLSASALVVGTGLFIILRPIVPPGGLALPLTAAVNGLLALPFVVRVLAPAIATVEAEHGRLADSLGLTGFARLRIVILPRVVAPLGFGAGVAGALSMGDLGVIALFAGPDQETLPLTMYRLMGAYRTDAAAAAGLVLVGSALLLFAICDRGGRRAQV